MQLGTITAAALALLGGAAVAYLNYRINLRALRKKPDALASLSFLRELLSVVYFVLVFYFSAPLESGRVPVLICAAVGLTIPSVLLAMRLSKISEQMSAQTEESSGEGEDRNG